MAGLSIAFVHLLFNIFGTLLFFPIKRLREVPVQCAEKLASLIEKSKFVGFGYVGTVFFLIPGVVIYTTK